MRRQAFVIGGLLWGCLCSLGRPAHAQVDQGFYGQLSPELVGGTDRDDFTPYRLQPATANDVARLPVPLPSGAKAYVGSISFPKGNGRDSVRVASLIFVPSLDAPLLYLSTRPGDTFRPADRLPMTTARDTGTGSGTTGYWTGAKEAVFDLPLPSGAFFTRYPLHIVYGAIISTHAYYPLSLMIQNVYAEGTVRVGRRSVRVQYTVDPLTGRVCDTMPGWYGMDGNGNGHITLTDPDAEVAYRATAGGPLVFRVADTYLSPGAVDLTTGRFRVDARTATDLATYQAAFWTDSDPVPSTADSAWHWIRDDASMTRCARYRLNDCVARIIRTRTERFIAAYPTDHRRWDALFSTMMFAPDYWADYAEAVRMLAHDSLAWIRIDTAARTAWEHRVQPLRAAFWRSSAVTDSMRASLAENEMEGLLGTATVRRTRLTATDMQRVTDSLMTFARFVDTNATARRLFGQRPSQFVVYVLTGPLSRVADTTTMDHFYQQLAHSNVSVSKDILEEAARLRRYRTTPLPLRGVTMAGNPLDLAQWRGKVVAIDFWATTCGPCIAEMPKFKALYDRYHAQGFEMVGIVSPRPEANDRALVLQILAQRHIPWPQLYGSPLKNVLLPDHALPYMLVVDPQGHIVTSVSGPGVTADELEPVLRRLLKQRTRYSSTKRPFFFRFHRYEVTPLRPSEFLQALRPQSHTSRKRHHERG